MRTSTSTSTSASASTSTVIRTITGIRTVVGTIITDSRELALAVGSWESRTIGVVGAPLMRLFRLSSAALPIGAFAYSQGLEQAVALGDVQDRDSALAWISGMLERSVLSLDVPVFVRLHRAFATGELAQARRWNDYLFAARGSAELRAEERQVGSALARLLSREGVEAATPWTTDPRVTVASGFALASVAWAAPAQEAALSYIFAWAEAQVGAATRLIPLGQTDAQRVLGLLIELAAAGIDSALARHDDDLSSTTPGQVLLSGLHETQYSRLFRS